MERKAARRILQGVKDGTVEPEEALRTFAGLEVEDLGFARIDHQRSLRKGFPEVIYAAGKQPEQVVEIAVRLYKQNDRVLITRANEQTWAAVAKELAAAQWNRVARAITICRDEMTPTFNGYIALLSAGTSDMPVAEEAAVTLTVMGHAVKRIYDVGVSGIHRLLAQQEAIAGASVVIVVAGMEGALASVVGGLTDRPVIAVPTSVGYGANFGGLAPLLTMLNSCASGVTVVNIDNGFGAGYAAALINAAIAEAAGKGRE